MARRVTLLDLRSYMRKWQKKLRLNDWEIRVDWATENQMKIRLAEDGDFPQAAVVAKQAVACTDTSNAHQSDTSWLEYRRNRILVKREKTLTKKTAESIVLHEMLHTLLWPLAPNDSDAQAMIVLEQIINTLERSLVETKDAAW